MCGIQQESRCRVVSVWFGIVILLLLAGRARGQTGPCAPQAPMTYPVGATIVREFEVCSRGELAAIACDGSDRLAVVYDIPLRGSEDSYRLYCERFDANLARVCSPLDACPTELSWTPPTAGGARGTHQFASVSMSRGATGVSPTLWVYWIGSPYPKINPNGDFVLATSGRFDDAPFAPTQQKAPSSGGPEELDASVAVTPDGSLQPVRAFSWTRGFTSPIQVNYVVDGAGGGLGQGHLASFQAFWKPCSARNELGQSTILWAEPESAQDPDSKSDIYVQQFDANGTPVPPGTTLGERVNSTTQGSQFSPAVCIDAEGRMAAIWYGPAPTGCTGPARRIMGQLLIFNASGPATPVGDEFVIDEGLPAEIGLDFNALPNPTVAISDVSDPRGPGRLFFAWNTQVDYGSGVRKNEVHGRYFQFSAGGPVPLGPEFRVPREQGSTGTSGLETRVLGQSGQHTAVFLPDGSVAVSWGRRNLGTGHPDTGVAVTILPAGFAEALCVSSCPRKGDVNGDGAIDGMDMQPFITVLIEGAPASACAAAFAFDLCPYDCNSDCLFNAADIPGFVHALLCGTPDCVLTVEPPTPPPAPDCNQNTIDDAIDIAEATSVDCNSDGVPDECQLAWNDCNSNGVLDVCDVDPEDPDGNEAVSEDCNTNGVPDECDLVAIYFPSYDCNTNGVPDECDIAEETSVDCNSNGVPDECDIAAEISADANTNGIPDECEEEGRPSMMQGGGSPYENLAWNDFWQWQDDNAATLAAMSSWDRFKATIDKLVELGLPAAIPWAHAQPSP